MLSKISNGVTNKICFTSIDVEDGGVPDLDKILDIFKKYNIPATLFVTGEALKKYGALFKNWAKDYEIACHSFSHRFWNTLNSKEREIELNNFISLYQTIFDYPPKGFRAPSHLMDKEGLELLEQKGFLYDSSILPHYPPFKKYRGYQGKKPLLPYCPPGRKILEIPVRGQALGIPLAGAWIRKLPFWFYQTLFFINLPPFLTVSFHSWEKSEKFKKVIKLLKNKNYQFLNGEQIYKNYR